MTIRDGLCKMIEKFWNLCWLIFWSTTVYFGELTGLYTEIWLLWYKFLAFVHRNGVAKLDFMNYGYQPLKKSEEFDLTREQKQLLEQKAGVQSQILLYEKLLSICPDHNFSNKDVLEVGCGHGGGIKWLLEAHPEFNSIKGMDIKITDTVGGKVFQGNAMDIPLENDSLDIVLNVESSHCYTFQLQYMSEVLRILRPGGYHLLADLRPIGYRWDMVWKEAQQAGLELVNFSEITDNVIASLNKQTERTLSSGENKWYMRLARPLWTCFWGKPGCSIYKDLVNRKWRYYVICWQKPIGKQ